MNKKDFLVMLKEWMDIIGVSTGMALSVYGILHMGILTIVTLAVTSIVVGAGIRLVIGTMTDKKGEKDEDPDI